MDKKTAYEACVWTIVGRDLCSFSQLKYKRNYKYMSI